MSIRFFDSGQFTYSSDSVQIDFKEANSIQIEIPVIYEASLDVRSNRLSATRSANTNDPTTITFILNSICTQDDSNIIDILSNLHFLNLSNGFPEKGILKIVDSESGLVRTFPDAILTKDPEFSERTIERGANSSNYTVTFISANFLKNG